MMKLQGTSGWRPFALPFDATGAPLPPTRLVLNLVLGRGTVYLGPLGLSEEDRAGLGGPSEGTANRLGGVAGALVGCIGALIGLLPAIRKRYEELELRTMSPDWFQYPVARSGDYLVPGTTAERGHGSTRACGGRRSVVFSTRRIVPESTVWPFSEIVWKYRSSPAISTSMNV